MQRIAWNFGTVEMQGRPAEVLSASLTKLLERVYADADAAHGNGDHPLLLATGINLCLQMCGGRTV